MDAIVPVIRELPIGCIDKPANLIVTPVPATKLLLRHSPKHLALGAIILQRMPRGQRLGSTLFAEQISKDLAERFLKLVPRDGHPADSCGVRIMNLLRMPLGLRLVIVHCQLSRPATTRFWSRSIIVFHDGRVRTDLGQTNNIRTLSPNTYGLGFQETGF